MRIWLTVSLAISCIIAISCDRRPSLDKQLDHAIQTGNTNYLQKYLASSGEVNRSILPASGQRIPAPLLHHAITHCQLGVIDFLLRNGADPNHPNGSGETPIIWAIGAIRADVPQSTRLRIFKRLLEAGANPNLKASSDYKYPPLLQAALLGQSEMVQILLSAGADIHATNRIGQTALHLAGTVDMARLLIAAGADPTARTVYGELPADHALKRRRFDVLNLLTNTPSHQ